MDPLRNPFHSTAHSPTPNLDISAMTPLLPTSRLSSAMSPCLLHLAGKSPDDHALAASLVSRNLLTLRDRDGRGPIDTSVRLVDDADSDSFSARDYFGGIRTRRFGRFLVWTPCITSTHDLLHQNFCEFPIGTVCVADVQTRGRGRVKNVWESPVGCLMFSYTMQMDKGRVLPLLQYVISLAVTEAVKDVCRERGLPQLDVKIKWPNDIYLNGVKVGGISCNSRYQSGNFNVSAGVGLNLDNKTPTTCLNAVLEEMASTGRQLRREDILAAFFNKFEDFFDAFLKEGFEVLEKLYYDTWLHSGQKVTIEELHNGLKQKVLVTIKGLTSCGYLLATDGENNYELHPDGNSFDFFKGLVRRKLS